MEKVSKIRKQSLIVLLIFFICILKYYFVNILAVVPIYGSGNRLLSWIFILPITIVGLLICFNIIFKSIKDIKNNYIDLIIILPFIIYFLYIFIYL